MAWKFAIALIVLALVAAVGLSIYGARLEPAQQEQEQVLPDDRFPS